MADESNYYQILELPLDPPVLSPGEVKAHIDKKRLEWDKKINSMGQRGVIYRKYKDLLPDISAKLADPKELKRQWEEAKDRTLRSFMQKLGFLAVGTGRITQSQLKALCERFPQLPEKVLRNYVSESNISVTADETGPGVFLPSKPEPPTGMELPTRAEMESLDINLEAYGAKSVYDVLKCTPTATLEALGAAARQFKQKARKMPKGTAKADASNVISMLASNRFFKSEAARKGFDYAWSNYLASKVINEDLEFFVVGDPPTISRKNYLLLIERLRGAGMSAREAEWYVYDECCIRRQAPYPAPPSNEAPQIHKRQCPHCFALTDKDARCCSKCGELLVIACPGCKREVEVMSRACSHCGFPVGDIPLATAALKKAKALYNQKAYDAALGAIEEVFAYWAKNEEATELKEKIKKIQRDLSQKRLKSVWEKILPPAGAKVVEGDSTCLQISWSPAVYNGQELKNNCVPIPEGGSAQISFRVVRKESAIPTSPQDGDTVAETTAFGVDDSGVKPGVIYGYAVFLKVDGNITEKGLPCGKGMLLVPPRGLQISAGDGRLTLTWTPLNGIVGTTIVRKRGGVPSRSTDGTVISLSGTDESYVDAEVDSGCTYGYLIYHIFRNHAGALLNGPVGTITGEAVAVPPSLPLSAWKVNTCDGKIAFEWAEPSAAHDTVQWYLTERTLGAEGSLLPLNHPSLNAVSPVRGVDSKAHRGSAALDFTGVRYLTPVVLRGHAALVCEGRLISAMPGVRNLSAQRIQGRLLLTWIWPEKCEKVIILYDANGYPEITAPSACARIQCDRRQYDYEKGCLINNISDSALYISVYAVVRHNDQQDFYSPVQHVMSVGASAKRRVNYSLVCKKSGLLFGKKRYSILIRSAKPGIPSFCIRSKKGSCPLNRNDGVLVTTSPSHEGTELEVPLEESVCLKGTCFKLFLAESSQSQLYSINHLAPSDLTIS